MVKRGNRIAPLPAALGLAVVLGAVGACTRAEEKPLKDAVEIKREQADALVEPLIRGNWCQGIVVGVVDPGGTRFFAYGSTGHPAQPPDERTVFEIGSVTKAFTGILLADAVVRKEVAFRDAIGKYLPEEVKAPAYGETPISLLDLATHTSALPRLPDNLQPKDPANPYGDYTVRQLHDFLSRTKLPRKPGEKSDYSNLGTGLLGHLLARRAGVSYEELLINRLCTPLALSETRITLTPEMRKRFARGHNADGEPVPAWDLPTLAGAGAIRSSAADMTRFLTANLKPGKTPLAEALRLSRQPHFRVDETTSMGLGWHLNSGAGTVWHNGQTGGFHSFAAFLPMRQCGVVVLANTATSLIDEVGSGLLALQRGVSPRPIKLPPTLALDPKTLDAYTGAYQFIPGVVLTVTRKDQQLRAQLTGQPAFHIYPEAENRFHLRIVDAQLTFERDKSGRDKSGKVTAVVLHQNGRDQRAPKQ